MRRLLKGLRNEETTGTSLLDRILAAAQISALRGWEKSSGEWFASLRGIRQPTLVVNGIHDEMIPVSNSYSLSENLPNAVLMTYPDSGHGSINSERRHHQCKQRVLKKSAVFFSVTWPKAMLNRFSASMIRRLSS